MNCATEYFLGVYLAELDREEARAEREEAELYELLEKNRCTCGSHAYTIHDWTASTWRRGWFAACECGMVGPSKRTELEAVRAWALDPDERENICELANLRSGHSGKEE